MKKLFTFLLPLAIVTGCSTNAVTGRKQLSLIPEQQLQEMALTQYKSFLSQNKVENTTTSKDAEMVKRVGSRIANAITAYYTQQGKGDVLNGYKWEFNLVDSKEVNAWCMPGGKVVVYSGLLPITQNEAALAVVLGHEITHAVAQHGNERMSKEMVAQGLGSLVGGLINNPQTASIFNGVYGVSSQVYGLKNSRSQEYEADHYGLLFCAMAGYNPQEAIPFWERMTKASNGAKPPEFLSDHPNDENRIARLKQYMPEALKYYKPIGK
ncbi:MAG: M48 family metallopeptidase [Bacteroidetes bacterium]|nr:M48 family metallopeptidase [Bacteroidota bacterium]MBS1756814.1 M48 family metallopeptidase [Bacteroidota bacterium]